LLLAGYLLSFLFCPEDVSSMFLQNVCELLFDYTAPHAERVTVVEGLFVQSLAKDGNCLFQRFHPFVAFEVIQNNAQLHINIREGNKMFMGKDGVWW
jgi:hypothetical protein